MQIQFPILSSLLKSPSKKYLRKLLQYVIMSRSSFQSFDPHSVTPVATSLSDDLQLSQQQTQSLIINLGRLINQAGRLEFKNLERLFPEEFDKELQEMLISMIVSMQQTITAMDDSRLTQAEKLIGFDWRLDMQMANQAGKKSESTALLELETVGEKGFKTTGFQMGIEQIGALHQNLKKIKDQLNSLIG